MSKRSYYSYQPSDENPLQEVNILRYISALSDKDYFGSLIDVITHDGFINIVTKYCGEELFNYIYTDIGIDERRNIINQIIDIAKELHRLGIAHLDLSLENFCIDKDKKVRVIDFGLAVVNPNFFPDEFEKYIENNSRVVLCDSSDLKEFKNRSAREFKNRSMSGPYGVTSGDFKCYRLDSTMSGKQQYMPPEVFYQDPQWDAFKYDLFSLGVCIYGAISKSSVFESHGDSWYKMFMSGKWLTHEKFKDYFNQFPQDILKIVDQLIKPSEIRVLNV